MIDQISIFDLMEEGTESRFTACVRKGSGFEGGRVRIYCAAVRMPVKELAMFLKDEYGVGGCSITFPDGQSGFLDYNSAGLKIWTYKTREEQTHKWMEAATEVKKLIFNNDYLNEKEWERVSEIRERFGEIPEPRQRYGI